MLAPMRSPLLTAATRPCARLRPHARTFAYGPKTEGTEALRKLRLMTAIKTPYNADGSIDLGAFDAHAEDQIQNGVEGFIIGGTTGEGHLFRWDEHIMLIAHTKHKFGDRCTVVGNTGSNNTGEAVNASEQGFAVGMDAALHINPYYGKTSEAGIVSHLNRSME
jgi:4-hydroxy-tetrahydrodipicolinate synthase